jgi:hypothetical protein
MLFFFKQVKSKMKSSFSETMPFLILRYYLINLGRSIVHPNLGSFCQFFIIKPTCPDFQSQVGSISNL